MELSASIGIAGIIVCAFIEGVDPEKYDNFTFKGALIASVVFLTWTIFKQQKARDLDRDNYEKSRIDERKFYEGKIESIVDQKNKRLLDQQESFIEYQKSCDMEIKAREQVLLNHINISNERMSGLDSTLEKINEQLENLNEFFEQHVTKATAVLFQAGLSRFNLDGKEDKDKNK